MPRPPLDTSLGCASVEPRYALTGSCDPNPVFDMLRCISRLSVETPLPLSYQIPPYPISPYLAIFHLTTVYPILSGSEAAIDAADQQSTDSTISTSVSRDSNPLTDCVVSSISSLSGRFLSSPDIAVQPDSTATTQSGQRATSHLSSNRLVPGGVLIPALHRRWRLRLSVCDSETVFGLTFCSSGTLYCGFRSGAVCQ